MITERIRWLILQSLPFWVASVLTGLAAVGYEKLFSWAEQASFGWFVAHPWLAFGLTPLAFVLAWALVRRFAPAARGSGIPQVMAGIELSDPARHQHTHYLLSLRAVTVYRFHSPGFLTRDCVAALCPKNAPHCQFLGE